MLLVSLIFQKRCHHRNLLSSGYDLDYYKRYYENEFFQPHIIILPQHNFYFFHD